MRNRPTKIFISLPIHPFLFAVLPVLNLYYDNIGLVTPRLLPRPLALNLFLSLLLFLLFKRLFKKSIPSSLLVSALFVFVFYVGATALILEKFIQVSFLLFIACWCGLFLGLFLFIGFSKRSWQKTNLFLNMVTVAWTVFLLVAIGRCEWRQQQIRFDRFPGDLQTLASLSPTAGKGRVLPDIYYIILDGYGRDDVLRDIYAVDASGFLRYLQSRGFFVADAAGTNYSQTLPSLASCLNMRYLDSLERVMGMTSLDRRPLMRLVGASDLVHFLRRQGYAIVAFDSLYTSVAIAGADLTMKVSPGLNDFEITLLNGTLLRPHVGFFGTNAHVRQTLYTLDELAKLGAVPTPKFVFAHLMCPHPPFVFSRRGVVTIPDRPFFYNDGSHYVFSWETYLDYLRGYREQVLFINRKLTALIDAVLKNSPTDPVIVLQGDHGPGSRLKHDDFFQTDLRERLAILNAMRIPAAAAGVLTNRISPVNTFRVVLNSYFQAGLPLLADRSYFLRWSQPYLPFPVDASAIGRRSAAP